MVRLARRPQKPHSTNIRCLPTSFTHQASVSSPSSKQESNNIQAAPHTHTQRPTQLFSMICQLKSETKTHRLEKPKTRTPRQNHPQTQSLSPLFPSLLTPSPSLSTTTSSSKPTTVHTAAPKTKFQNSDFGPQKLTHTTTKTHTSLVSHVKVSPTTNLQNKNQSNDSR